MPSRKYPLINNETYHVFNKSIHLDTLFSNKRDCKRAQHTMWFYQYKHIPTCLSQLLRLPNYRYLEVVNTIVEGSKRVKILAYCLMSNHFHFLVTQLEDTGLSRFMSDVQNSYTRYYNGIHDHKGPIFLPQFKAVRIESDEQLIHVSRYIHLNPLTAYVVKDLEALVNYPWSSLPEYQGASLPLPIVETESVMNHFKSTKEYLLFIEDNADYQKQLHQTKHLM